MHLRRATPADAARIAALHARSWQYSYRADFDHHYLDREAPAERLAVWTDRFAAASPDMVVELLEEGPNVDLLGFGCLFLRKHPDYGHLVDKLHVEPTRQGGGFGRRLLVQLAEDARALDPDVRHFYLLVLVSNAAAIGFYEHLGARRGPTVTCENPGGTRTPALTMQWDLRAAVLRP